MQCQILQLIATKIKSTPMPFAFAQMTKGGYKDGETGSQQSSSPNKEVATR